MIFADRVDVANNVLSRILPVAHLEIEHNLLICCWARNGKKYRKPWSLKCFIPNWEHQFLADNHDMTLLAYMVRWCFGQPTMPLSNLKHRNRLDAVPFDILEIGDYPKTADCILCFKLIDGQCEWHNDLSLCGPICLTCEAERVGPGLSDIEDQGILSHVQIEEADEPIIVITKPEGDDDDDGTA